MSVFGDGGKSKVEKKKKEKFIGNNTI